MPRKGLPYFGACKSWPAEKLAALEWICENGVEIDRATFLGRVAPSKLRSWEKVLGYRNGRSMVDDWHVRYQRSPDGMAYWFVHSAIEYVFARPETIDAIQTAALEEAHAKMTQESRKVLILVHPGSLFGSAEMNVGKMEARAAREEIFLTVADHAGPILVIDGMFSDEIPPADGSIIEAAIAAARKRGDLALRAWGCDAGEAPPEAWLAKRRELDGGEPIVADGQRAVIERLARDMGAAFADLSFGVTGAWASYGDSGCVNSVVDAVRDCGGKAATLECALYEPDAEEDCEDVLEEEGDFRF